LGVQGSDGRTWLIGPGRPTDSWRNDAVSDQLPPMSHNDRGEGKSRAPKVTIGELRVADVDAAVEVHLQAFPGFFLSFLGRSFLRQFYLAYCDDRTSVALVATRDQPPELLGAVIGPLRPAGFYKSLLLRRWWRFGLAACAAVLRRPLIIPRLVRAVSYRGDAPADRTDRALLSSVAVRPGAQGMGIGKMLVRAFLEKTKQAGLRGAYLTTDADNNDAVNAFYRRMGFKVESEFTTPEGRRMFRHVYDFCDHPE